MQNDKGRASFAGKLFRLLPRPTKQCPKEIGYREVTMYGELLYRSRLNLKTTLADLASLTGYERWRTLPKVVRRLQRHGLADEQLRPLLDEKGCFHRKKTRTRRWQDEFQTTTIYRLRPDAELTDIQNSILWTVHSFNSAGQRPHVRSVAKLLRLDCRTVIKHLKQLQEHCYLDADLHVVADPELWQDTVPKLPGDPEVRWAEFAAAWVAARYDDGYCGGKTRFAISRSHLRRSLQEGCEAMAGAGYTSVHIRDYWEREVPEACRGKGQLVLLEYYLERVFYKLFDAVEQVTTHNRQLGKFHGANSLGLLRKVTASTARAMQAQLVERGADGLETWVIDFSSLGTTMRGFRTKNIRNRAPVQAAPECCSSEMPSTAEEINRMFRRCAPELDADAWLPRILGSPRFKDDPEQLSLDCYEALSDCQSHRERNLERLLHEGNGKA